MPTDPTGLEHQTPTKIKDTSATERGVFRKCRRQWLLSTVHRLQSAEGNENFWLGTLVHTGLEGYYRWRMEHPRVPASDARALAPAAQAGLDRYQEAYDESISGIAKELGFLWENVAARYEELGQLGYDMLAAYFEREPKDPIYDTIVDVERRVFVPITSPSGRRVGRLSVMTDLVGRRDGALGVADHKTASREASASQLDLDDQLTAEVFAVWKTRGEFPEEATYNVLMKKVPQPPKRLKDGKGGAPRLSQDKTQLTTYELYLEAINELGISVVDYQDTLNYYWEQEQSGESPFFRRERVLRTEYQMASFEANLREEWRDMRAVALHPERAYPSPSPFSCPSCPVRLVCVTMMDDGDVSAIIQAGYVVGDPRR
jgi:hypothetical protein